jgi:sulfite exporter TauE/SafE
MPGVVRAKVSFAKGSAVVSYDEEEVRLKDIVKAVERLDYAVQRAPGAGGRREGKSVVLRAGGFLLAAVALYWIVGRIGAFDFFRAFPEAKAGMNYGMLFVIGLLTSLHCVAMCGGINLCQCVGVPSGPNRAKLSSLRPSFLYNFGRVLSYTAVGGIVGGLGSVISLTGAMQGIVQIAAGVFMVIMGANMTGLFPSLRKLAPRLPKAFSRASDEAKAGRSPMIVGLLNGLMPCGPLQAMQLYALSTGNPVSGAFSMLLFGLGTVPLMFGLGALSALLSKRFTRRMMAVSAVLVVVLGISMFTNGLSLSGLGTGSMTGMVKTGQPAAPVASGVQVITTTLERNSYEPITVQKGIPVKWIIRADAANLNGCNNEIIISKLNMKKKLIPGDNVIEFTPTQTGVIPYSCWMGMIRSRITVVDGDVGGTGP